MGATPPSTAATTTTARGPLTPSPRPRPIPMSSTAVSATAPTPTATASATPATPAPTTVASTTTARGALTPSPRLMPTTATTATPAPTVATTDTHTTAKCTKDLRSSTGRIDQPTQQYSMKCDETEPTITRSKLPKKRPAPCALYLSQSTKLPLAETVLMMSARKKQNTE